MIRVVYVYPAVFVSFLYYTIVSFFFFFFQAEDGIRDHCVTGVQTCALPICMQVLQLAAWPASCRTCMPASAYSCSRSCRCHSIPGVSPRSSLQLRSAITRPMVSFPCLRGCHRRAKTPTETQ